MKKLLHTMFVTSILAALFFSAEGQSYCTVSPAPDCNGTVYISNVTLGSINRTSGCDGYINTGLSTDLLRDSTYTIYLTVQNEISYYSSQIRIFIDYNRDSDFCDLGEVIHNEWDLIPGSYSENFTFTVPAGATLGMTRMRVMIDSAGGSGSTHAFDGCGGGSGSPCGSAATFTGRGEVEDYYINLRIPAAPDCPLATYPANSSTGIPLDTMLHWSDAGGGTSPTTGYKLYFGTDNPPTNLINDSNVGNATSFSLNYLSLQHNARYYWKVVAYNSVGTSTACDSLSFTTLSTVGVNEHSVHLLSPAISPNPFNDRIDLNFTAVAADVVKIELMNIAGSLIYSDFIKTVPGNNNIISIPADKYADGVYLCRLTSGADVVTLKVVKISK